MVPIITVLMPVWNGQKFLRDAIESIIAQTEKRFEFLILDDGSTDSTPQILAEYAAKDSRIRIIPLDHKGIVSALNQGVAEARAEWIARMDCDDIAHPKRLEKQWRAVQANPDAVLCHTQIHIIGEAPYITKAARFIRSEAMIRLRLCYQCPIYHSSVMFHKAASLAVGGYLEDERHAEDFSLWGRLIEMGAIAGVPQPMLDFRVHQSSISKQNADVQIPLSLEIAKRHARQFMRLNENDAQRAVNTLRYHSTASGLGDWFWLVTRCLPRMEKQSLELWIWAAQATVRRLLKSIAR
jgi:glycosyltransferase involved in cell wall biosynthesis